MQTKKNEPNSKAGGEMVDTWDLPKGETNIKTTIGGGPTISGVEVI